jgi:hypothetical protein
MCGFGGKIWNNRKDSEKRRQKWEDHVKIDITQTVQEDVNTVHLFQGRKGSRLC